VLGIKSKIRKNTAGKSSSYPEYAQASFQNSSEPSHSFGPRPNNRRHLSAVQEMFGRGRRCRSLNSRGIKTAASSRFVVSAVSKVPFGRECHGLDNFEGTLRFRTVQVNGYELIDFGAGDGEFILQRHHTARRGAGWSYTHPPLKQRTGRTCGGSSLGEDVPPVGRVDQN
jgi:hypothetical protein